MPDEFEIESRFAVHSSGTKAYQVWLIRQGDGVLAVNQYGSWKPSMKASELGGNVDVHPTAGDRGFANKLAAAKIKSKTNRGYNGWEKDSYPANTKGDFVSVLTDLFGVQKQQDILKKLLVFAQSTPVPMVDPDNVVMGKAKPIAPATEQSLPEWGTW